MDKPKKVTDNGQYTSQTSATRELRCKRRLRKSLKRLEKDNRDSFLDKHRQRKRKSK